MTRGDDIKQDWPKGCPAPIGYADWFEWARAQKAHGIKQEQCGICGLWLFPQDKHGLACTSAEREAVMKTGTPK